MDITRLNEISGEPPVRHRRPGGWAMAILVLVLGAMAITALVTNPGFDWGTVAAYLFDVGVVEGVWITVQLTVYAMVIGIILGVILAVLRQSSQPIPRAAAALYVWFFRGTPVLVQVLFWGFAAALYPRLGLGIPWGPQFVSWDTNSLIPFFAAAVIGLGLNEAAYMAEIVRGGLLSVPAGQSEAAYALGLGHTATLRQVVLPQAVRVIIPPIGNQTISMLKMTSIVLVIGVMDLLGSVTQIYSRNYRQIPMLIVASLWYLAMTTVLTFLQTRLERRLARGAHTTTRTS